MVLNCNIREYTRKKPLIEKNKENIFLFVFKISINCNTCTIRLKNLTNQTLVCWKCMFNYIYINCNIPASNKLTATDSALDIVYQHHRQQHNLHLRLKNLTNQTLRLLEVYVQLHLHCSVVLTNL